jgi:hypothetical protein
MYVKLVNIVKMQKCKSTGLSLPRELMLKIDRDRGDIPRSRFLLRIIEEAYVKRQLRGGSE